MNFVMWLALLLNIPKTNYGIYEQDIKYFGGDVIYQGNIITQSRRSKVEEAVVKLNEITCRVYMERFRDGSAALLYFIKDRFVQEGEMCSQRERFLMRMLALSVKDPKFEAHERRRKIKQYITLAAQILCVIISFWASDLFWKTEFSIGTTIMYLFGPIMIFVWGSFYKYYRLAPIDTSGNV